MIRKWTPNRLRWFLNWYPPYLGAGVRVDQIADDWTRLRVSMPLRWYNRNAVGTHFGGSLYSMVDPHLMLLLIGALGREYTVWDQAATIHFRRPGRGRVSASIELPAQRISEIREQAQDGQAHRPEFSVQIIDDDGTVVADVQKVIYVRRKRR